MIFGGGCRNYVLLSIPTIPTLPIRLVHHHVLPLFLNPPPTMGRAPSPAVSLALSPSLFLFLSTHSLFFLFFFLLAVVYRRSLRLAPRSGAAELLLLLLLMLELRPLELLELLLEGLAEGAPPLFVSKHEERGDFCFFHSFLISTGQYLENKYYFIYEMLRDRPVNINSQM